MIEKGSKLKAKCPDCNEGCDKCFNGYTEVTFGAEDSIMYSLICNDCETCAGGGFIDSKSAKMLECLGKHAMCPGCGGKNLKKVIEDES